ncbi:uncharacterized protein LOC131301672 [Rhododendron vialii]|uniref:uncharacterized protein LOC131301672 n=1 Tax=Rhododendron vialii TaxID=182163 RepID=UPI00265FE6CE|nr:uncharacterized protein LOC131301672 [Rhododendron vialii]
MTLPTCKNLPSKFLALLVVPQDASVIGVSLSIFTKKKGNRLAQKRLNDLVFVKYNRALKCRYLKRDHIDPISLKEIDQSNEWLVGKMEEEFVFEGDGDDLNWDDVALASGAKEPRKTTRASSSKSTDSTPIAKLAKPTPKAKASRGKTSLIDEENEEEEWETDDEEEDVEGYKSESSDDDEEQDEVLGSENDD